MRLLFDTHLVIWLAEGSPRLSARARAAYLDRANTPVFSVVSIWEIAIKTARRRQDFGVDPRALREGLLQARWAELTVSAAHAIAVAELPSHHSDPFDRLLIAQARVEQMTFFTSDRPLAPYGAPVRIV